MENKKYREFYKLSEELISKGKKFDGENLKLIAFKDLTLAGIGNAGKAACDYRVVDAERKRRIDTVIDMSIGDIENDKGIWKILDDMAMYYAWYHEKANKSGPIKISDAPKWRLLVKAMHDLRGDWSDGKDSQYLKKIYELLPQVEVEGVVPLGWCQAVKMNADTFDGEFNDGRIMRDGRMRLPEDVARKFGFPSTDASGNIAKMLGAKIERRSGGYRGSYEELFEDILTPDQKIIYISEIIDETGKSTG